MEEEVSSGGEVAETVGLTEPKLVFLVEKVGWGLQARTEESHRRSNKD